MNRRAPMHRQIADELRRRIGSGQYSDGGLPPELVLMREFAVSRHTIRSALQSLVNDGLISRRAGQGTQLTNRGKGGCWLIGSLNELLGDFSADQYLTISVGLEPVRRFASAAALFQLGSGKFFHVLRLMTIQGLPYAVVNVFTLPEYATRITPSEVGNKPLLHLVEERNGIRATRARQMASAALADERTAQQLGIPVGSAVLVLHRTYFDGEGHVIVHNEMLIRPDRYQQIIDFVHEANILTGSANGGAAEPARSA